MKCSGCNDQLCEDEPVHHWDNIDGTFGLFCEACIREIISQRDYEELAEIGES